MSARILFRKTLILALCIFAFASVNAQDSSGTRHLTLGLNMGIVSNYKTSGTDTGFANSLTQTPVITLGHRSGFSVRYAPMFELG